MRVWSIANQKGGVGKTSSVVSLAGLLAQSGKRVLMLDLDPQGSLTSYFRLDPDNISHSLYDLFMHKGQVPDHLPGMLLHETPLPGVKLMPSSTALATLERSVASQEGMGLIISRSLAKLWDDFDYAIIDTPPQLGVLLINALAACQQIVLPVQTEFMALKGLERMLNTLSMVMRSRKQQLPYLIVPTMYDRRTSASQQALTMLRKQHQEHLWHAAIPVDTRLRDASVLGQFISVLDPESRASQAYAHLVKDLLKPKVGAVEAAS